MTELEYQTERLRLAIERAEKAERMLRLRDSLGYDVDVSTKYREWQWKIPHVAFRPEWDVRAIPPFAGAIIRYLVRHNDLTVSIYLDAYDFLGAMGAPYWEMLPNINGEFERFLLNETTELVAAVAKSLERNEVKP